VAEARPCWAKSLGPCAGRISGEHYVSQAVFDTDVVSVHGLPWCKDEAKQIPLRSMTANILCAYHNSELSPLDAAAGEAFIGIREATRLYAVRLRAPLKRWTSNPAFLIDGLKLERWALKTLIAFCFRGPKIIGPGSQEPGACPDEYVALAYGKEPFRGHAGLYGAVRAGQIVNSPEGTAVSIVTLIPESEERVVGALFSLNGFVMGLWLDPDTKPFQRLSFEAFGEDLRQLEFFHHFKGYDFKIDKKNLSHRLKIIWA